MTAKKLLEEGRDYLEERAPQEIEQNRKGDFSLCFTINGKPLPKADIRYRLLRHDYDFGCNLFMLDQYDTQEENETYLTLWKQLFNTAVVPLYWERTEPEQGKLRYDKDASPFYRRPPLERVMAYCRENHIAMKGHPLFWHEFIPTWLPEDFDTLYPLIEKRFAEIARLSAADIPVYDCVNEPSRIWDMTHEHRTDGYKMLAPPDGYVEKLFALANRYFPHNELILNEATGQAFCHYRGSYGGYYLYVKGLLEAGVPIDRVGLQCHIDDSPEFANLYDARRLYSLLDGYERLGRPLVLSEIGLSLPDEELQAEAARQLYTIWFSHPATNGIFWWNLDDNGILCHKSRQAGAENLPYGGLCRQARPKAAYHALLQLIRHDWHTEGSTRSENGTTAFRGFFGRYEVEIFAAGVCRKVEIDLGKKAARTQTVAL